MPISETDKKALREMHVNALASGDSRKLADVGGAVVEVLDAHNRNFVHRHRISDNGAIVIDGEARKEMREYLKAYEPKA